MKVIFNCVALRKLILCFFGYSFGLIVRKLLRNEPTFTPCCHWGNGRFKCCETVRLFVRLLRRKLRTYSGTIPRKH